MRGIGAMARASGLSISALRFYDAEGVLVPSWVDPDSGYRWYDDNQVISARLIAGLRRVGMPLPEILRLLEARHARPIVAKIIDDHLGRLEAGLADARHELSRVMSIIDDQENTMNSITTLTVSSDHLTAALSAVRYAASLDQELPNLTGVWLDVADGTASAVATDRFRLALAPIGVTEVTGPSRGALVSVAFVHQLIDTLPAGQAVTISLRGGVAEVSWPGGGLLEADLPEIEFPNYRMFTGRDQSTHSVTLDVAAFRQALEAAPRNEAGSALALMSVSTSGDFCFDGSQVDGVDVGLNREFLLEALDGYAADPGTQLVLGLDGPIAPLMLSDPARPGELHMLMPVKLDAVG